MQERCLIEDEGSVVDYPADGVEHRDNRQPAHRLSGASPLEDIDWDKIQADSNDANGAFPEVIRKTDAAGGIQRIQLFVNDE